MHVFAWQSVIYGLNGCNGATAGIVGEEEEVGVVLLLDYLPLYFNTLIGLDLILRL